jgi:acyl dehydratase
MAIKTVENSATDLAVGDQQAPLEFVVTPELNEQYVYAEEDYHPRYLTEGPWGKPLAHPGFVINMTTRARSPSFKLPPGWSSIHARCELRWFQPARVGDKLTVNWTVVDLYERKNRPYQAVEAVVTNERGEVIMRRVVHSTVSRPSNAVSGKN